MTQFFLGQSLRTLVAGAVLFALAIPARGALPEEYRKLWSDPVVNKRINDGIERNRKQDAVVEIRTASGQPAADATVELRQKTHEFLFGCNAFVLGQLDTPEKNRKYEEAFVKLFNFATVPFYWEGTEPTQGELRYAEGGRDIWRRPPPDRFLPWAKKHGITLKGHPLLWHSSRYNAPWLPKDAEELKRLYQKRFAEIAARYAQDITIWDMVNESLVCSKEYPLYSDDRAYVGWAFKEGHRVFPASTLLMINEVTKVSHEPVAVNRYYPQVQQLLAQGADVRGIGFQFHCFSPKIRDKFVTDPLYSPTNLLDVYEHFAQFKLPLWVTEITIPDVVEEGQTTQAEVIANFYRVWFAAPRMAGITWWNLGDGTAVKHENVALGGLIDESFDPKESYRALDKLINHDWKTQLTVQTDAQGALKFRGFCGKYVAKVTAGGVTKEFEISLSKDGPATHQLSLKP